MVQQVTLRVEKEDYDILMDQCKRLFVKDHPEFEGMKLSQKFMFKKVIRHYLRDGLFF